MSYFCTHCDEPVPSRICPTCLQPAEERDGGPPPSPDSGATQNLTRPVSRLLQETAAAPEERREGTAAEGTVAEGTARRGEAAPERPRAAPEPPPDEDSRSAGAPPSPPAPEPGPSRPRRDLEGAQAIPRVTSFPTGRTAATAGAEDAATIKVAGQRELLAFLDQGFRVVLVAGIGGVGKTQLLDAYRKPGTLSMLHSKKDERGGVVPTAHGQLDCYPVQVGGEKVIFVDAAGETFASLYPHVRRGGAVNPADVEFLRAVARHLRGVVLLLDLRRLWSPDGDSRVDHRQDEILAWLLQLLRWLRFSDGRPQDDLALEKQVVAETARMRQRLPEPVLVLFSKADELLKDPVPLPARSWREKQSGRSSRRAVYPLGDDPFFLAWHYLDDLYGAVREHAAHFRFDFVQSVVEDADTGMLDESGRCGVRSSVEWLLDEDWDKHNLPTRHWIALQRLVDTLTFRGRRWRRMPEPRELR